MRGRNEKKKDIGGGTKVLVIQRKGAPPLQQERRMGLSGMNRGKRKESPAHGGQQWKRNTRLSVNKRLAFTSANSTYFRGRKGQGLTRHKTGPTTLLARRESEGDIADR